MSGKMEGSQTVTYTPNVVSSLNSTTKLRWPHNFGGYRLSDHDVASGSLLGNPHLQVRLKATGAIEQIFCVAAGKALIKTFVLKHWDERSGMKLDPLSGHFMMFPEHQEHKYLLSNGVYIAEHVFVSSPQPGAVHYVVDFTNDSEEPQRIATFAFCELTCGVDEELVVEFDEELRALVAHTKDEPKLARAVGARRKPASYEVSIDHAMAVTPNLPPKLSGNTQAPRGLAMGVLHYSTALEPGERATLPFTLFAGAQGVAAVKNAHRSAPAAKTALQQTQQAYHDVLARTVVMTPNAEINRGVLWAKANMERVVLQTPTGWGFTNSPTKSNKCVGRDAAWFCAGTDYFRQGFSKDCLHQFFERQEDSGMFVEDYDMLEGKTEDYGLNVNDDTPLLIWSAWHHYQLSRDDGFLERSYPALARACRYIASQRNDDGLVWCTSKETGSKGIVGWRNVIQNYRISGAVTELNAECFAAARSMATLARAANEEKDASEFDALADELREAANRHLYNPGNGLYYLNIDVYGTPRSDVTADLIFPVIFGLAPRNVAAHIIRRLSDRDFWTPGGMRTIPHDAVNYSPDESSGCFGGVWNGVTFWYAKAAAEYMPDFAAEALTNGFENYARNPQRNNTVPGEFSEWLHGQTLVNEGMLLSPWFPPRYIWATVEGLLGFNVSGERPRITPHLPSGWTWSGIRNMPYRGRTLTWFCARVPELRMWACGDVDAANLERFAEDAGDDVFCSGDDARAMALRDGDRIVAIAGNTADRTITTALRVTDREGSFTVKRFSSLSGSWGQSEQVSAQTLERGVTVVLEPKGFELFEIRSES